MSCSRVATRGRKRYFGDECTFMDVAEMVGWCRRGRPGVEDRDRNDLARLSCFEVLDDREWDGRV